MTLIPSVTFSKFPVVSMEHLQRVRYASRDRLPFRTFGSVGPFGDLLMLHLLRPVLPKFACLFSAFHHEYPSVLSRFCLGLEFRWINIFSFWIKQITLFLGKLSSMFFFPGNINYFTYFQGEISKMCQHPSPSELSDQLIPSKYIIESSSPRNVTSIHSLIHGVLGRWLAEAVVTAVPLCMF